MSDERTDTHRPHRAGDGTAYDLLGPAEAPVVVLIHGLGLCRELWTDHLPALSACHRVVNYDLYGHGQSAPPPKEASLTVYSDQIEHLLDHLDIERAAIIGFSIGGMINRRFALDHPTRLWALGILNSPHDRGSEAQRQVEERASNVRSGGAMATMDSAIERWFTPAFRSHHPDRTAWVREWRAGVDPESYAQAAWVLANGVRELIKPADPIDLPSLVMTCENDTGSTPAMSHAIAAELSDSRTVVVPGYQHLGLMEEPSAFTVPMLDFLETVVHDYPDGRRH